MSPQFFPQDKLHPSHSLATPPSRFSIAASAPLGQLPARLTPLVGRGNELREIRKLLGQSRLVTLVGPGGVGKSALALSAAHQSQASFAHGAYLVALSPLTSSEWLLPTIAEALKFSFYSSREPLSQLLDYLRERELLLLIDNFEHLLPAASLLSDILHTAPHVHMLVTSRERLNLYAERVLEIPTLEFPPGEHANDPQQYSAVRMFVESAQRLYPEFALTEEQYAPILRICQLVDGLPLGLELAAKWVRYLPSQEIVAGIERSLDFLSNQWRDIPERHHSLRAVFDHSWALLTSEEQQTLRRFSLFANGCQAEAAERIAGPRATLFSLVDKSLLQWNPALQRYHLHSLLQRYAQERLAEAGETEQIRARHAAYFAEYVQRHEAGLIRGKLSQELAPLTVEMENIRLAWQWAWQHAHLEQIAQSQQGLFRLYEIRSWYQEGSEAFAAAIQALQGDPAPSDARLLLLARLSIRRGIFLQYQGRFDAARQALHTGLHLLDSLPEAPREESALGYYGLGQIANGQGNYEEAKQLLEKAVLQARAGEAAALEGKILCLLGAVYCSQGYCQEAQEYGNRALALQRKMGDPLGEADALTLLGVSLRRAGAPREAIGYYERSFEVYHQTGHPIGEARVLNNLGVLYKNQGEEHKARTCYERCLAICQEIGHQRGQGMALNNIGILSNNQGDYRRAQLAFEQALEINRLIGDQEGDVSVLGNLSLLYHNLGNEPAALEYGQRAWQIAQEIGEKHSRGYLMTYIGHALAGLGQLPQAVEAYRQSIALHQEAGQADASRDPWAALAMTLLSLGQPAEAFRCVDEILRLSKGKPIEENNEPGRVYLGCFEVLRASGDPRAAEVLQQAQQFLQAKISHLTQPDEQEMFKNVPFHRQLLQEIARSTLEPGGRGNPSSYRSIEALSSREMEVLCLIAGGHTNQEIAAQLHVTINTVKTHVQSLFGKLGIASRTQAVRRAQEMGILPPVEKFPRQ